MWKTVDVPGSNLSTCCSRLRRALNSVWHSLLSTDLSHRRFLSVCRRSRAVVSRSYVPSGFPAHTCVKVFPYLVTAVCISSPHMHIFFPPPLPCFPGGSPQQTKQVRFRKPSINAFQINTCFPVSLQMVMHHDTNTKPKCPTV